MKNIWKLLMVAMMAITMVGCPQPENKTDEGGSSYAKIYVAGFNNVWANDTGVGTCPQMKTTDGENYTVTLKADSKNPTPYGIKFASNMGWAKQYARAEAWNLTEDTIKYVTSGEEVLFKQATKAQVEGPTDVSADVNVKDNNTKIYMKEFVEVGSDVTINFNLKTLKGSITYTGTGIDVTSIFVDGINPGFNSSNGNFSLELDEDASSENVYVFTGEFTFSAADNGDWGQGDAATIVAFGITEAEGTWSQKFTGATLTLGAEGAATYGADNNNSVSGLVDGETYTVKVTATATDTLLWSECTVKILISNGDIIPDPDSSEIAAESSEAAAESSEAAAESSEAADSSNA